MGLSLDVPQADSPFLCDKCGHATRFRKSHLLPDKPKVSQVRDILRYNTLPLETSFLVSVMKESSSELARYEAEIDRLTTMRDQLVSERAALKAFVADCQHVVSPVRRLPPEILTEIFDMCGPPNPVYFSVKETPAQEMYRVAQRHLLDLSQVCFHWHAVSMTTPRLWSTLIVDTRVWQDCAAPRHTLLLEHLESSLQRSASHPLTLSVADSGDADAEEHPVLELLAKHSDRWLDVFLQIKLHSLHFLAGVGGKLPLLQRMDLCDSGGRKMDTDIFRAAPRLTQFTFDGKVSRIPTVPWEQLQCFRYYSSGQSNIFRQLSLMRRLSINTIFYFTLNPADIDLSIDIPSILSDIAFFSLELFGPNDNEEHVEVQEAIFDALTLPSLLSFKLCRDLFDPAAVWCNTHFLTFAARSTLNQHLTALNIRAIITDEELLQCLAVLPLLEVLIISDIARPSEHAVVTDLLLRRLTWKADAATCLIPHLHYFNCTSCFKFTPDAYWNFLTSRLVPGRTRDKIPSRPAGLLPGFFYPHVAREPFQVQFWWFSSGERQLPPEAFADLFGQMVQLTRSGRLGFRSGPPGELLVGA
ncbi:hypothetical protein C8R43DRAFT_72627 [Mycena crocata]|nr:hypothetical protein C8R43DRAFT_72627 [Mycena crocata]